MYTGSPCKILGGDIEMKFGALHLHGFSLHPARRKIHSNDSSQVWRLRVANFDLLFGTLRRLTLLKPPLSVLPPSLYFPSVAVHPWLGL